MGKLARQISYTLILKEKEDLLANAEAREAAKHSFRSIGKKTITGQLHKKQKGRCYYCGLFCRLCAPENGCYHQNDFATKEHVYPRQDIRRMLEDLVGFNKIVMACYKCNQEQGHEWVKRFVVKDTVEQDFTLINILKGQCKTLLYL